MIYNEIYQDIFTVDKYDYMAHCIASDFRMGAGIAIAFQKKFKLKNKLFKIAETQDTSPGSCILIGKVFNLITKKRSSGKPTYKTLEASLKSMRKQLDEKNESSIKILMPKIGCGLDRLQWGEVSEIIQDVFESSNFQITICKWRK